MRAVHLLYLAEEAWPTYRADLASLFGKYLPRSGITSDIVTEQGPAPADTVVPWGGGAALLCRAKKGRASRHVGKLWHNVSTLVRCNRTQYDAIQVRDMPVTALAGLIVARIKRLPFFYWMSYPQSEGQVLRAKARGPRAGLSFWFPLIQGTVGQWLLYRLVLRYADHVFVQSEHMGRYVASWGIASDRMTPVPMGVDLDLAQRQLVHPTEDPRLEGKQVMVYLGTLDRARDIDMLFHMLARVRAELPDAVLVLAGDTEDAQHRAWLEQEARRIGVMDAVIWTGWLPTHEAWRYVRAAQVGLSPVPRGFLLDCGSPTKAMEYMALGIPVVANDNPDQKYAVEKAQCGLCVEFSAAAFAQALLALLGDPARCAAMGVAGQRYVREHRGYNKLAAGLANAYREFFHKRQAG